MKSESSKIWEIRRSRKNRTEKMYPRRPFAMHTLMLVASSHGQRVGLCRMWAPWACHVLLNTNNVVRLWFHWSRLQLVCFNSALLPDADVIQMTQTRNKSDRPSIPDRADALIEQIKSRTLVFNLPKFVMPTVVEWKAVLKSRRAAARTADP